LNSSTIAAIVTSLGGPPAAVGIVRLSGPSAVGIVGRLFRPRLKKKRQSSMWKPRSHVVEYGMVLDSHGNVIDEVQIGTWGLLFSILVACFSDWSIVCSEKI
jgi:tRNA modification GTPase